MPRIKTIKLFRWLWIAFSLNDYGDVVCHAFGMNKQSAENNCLMKGMH